jgi:acyl carrier protein
MTDPGDAKPDLARQLIEILAAEAMVDIDKLTPETPLTDLDIQSADYVMILMAVEEKFGTYISVDTDFADAKTVGDLIRIVASRIEAGTGATA